AESRASGLSATVLPASTGAGFGVTSQQATDEAVGAAPQPGATQVPSSQTWPELQSLELKRTVTPWPTVAAKASVTTAAVVAAAATMIRINPSVFIGVWRKLNFLALDRRPHDRRSRKRWSLV